MKVGSLVECIKLPSAPYRYAYDWLPAMGEVYTVEEIGIATNSPRTLIRLSEHSMGRTPEGVEFGMDIGYFREIQPPMDLAELIEETMLQEL